MTIIRPGFYCLVTRFPAYMIQVLQVVNVPITNFGLKKQ